MATIEALLGLEVDDEQKLREMAEQLRGRRRAAEFFSASTVDPISKGAQAELTDVDAAAKAAGGYRQQGLQRALQQKMQEDRFEEQRRRDQQARRWQQDDDLLQFERGNEEYLRKREDAARDLDAEQMQGDFTTMIDPRTKRTTQVRIVGGDILNSQGVPVDIGDMMKLDEYQDMIDGRTAARGSAEPAYGDRDYEYTEAKTKDEREKELTEGRDLASLVDLAGTYDPEFGPTVPYTGGVENIVGEYLPSTELAERQAKWWKNWKNKQELVQRHELFGSALTRSEQEEWRRATIGPSTKPEIVQEYLKKMRDYSYRLAEANAAKMIRDGRHPDAIQDAYGPLLGDLNRLRKEVLSGAYSERIRAMHEKDAAERRSRGIDDATIPTMDDGPIADKNLSMEELYRMAGEEPPQ